MHAALSTRQLLCYKHMHLHGWRLLWISSAISFAVVMPFTP
jgi:hypothetical protein